MRRSITNGFISIVDGWAMILSFGTYRPPRSPEVEEILNRSDADALKGDWEAAMRDWESLYGGRRDKVDPIDQAK